MTSPPLHWSTSVLCGRCRHPKPTRHPAESKSITPEIPEETQKMKPRPHPNSTEQSTAPHPKRPHLHQTDPYPQRPKNPSPHIQNKKLATVFYEQVNAHSNSLINIQAAMDAQRTHNMPIQTTHLRRF
ncbi:hypothetical protein TNCV_3143621 [Trichonephila clavipes]|nr:hypothetical protein TNCV_3143621 [Trichonephila clavipes]